jgi:hypothetical protein
MNVFLLWFKVKLPFLSVQLLNASSRIWTFSHSHFRPTSKQKLMTMFELTENDIKQIYKLPFKTMKNCKFQWLQ